MTHRDQKGSSTTVFPFIFLILFVFHKNRPYIPSGYGLGDDRSRRPTCVRVSCALRAIPQARFTRYPSNNAMHMTVPFFPLGDGVDVFMNEYGIRNFQV